MKRRIDDKHHIETRGAGKDEVIEIVKTTNNQPIPAEEPVILFRGRDRLALPMLEFYRGLCVNDGCTAYQLESMDKMIDSFRKFAAESPTMKQPGITLGK